MLHRIPKSARRLAQSVRELNQAILDNDNERESRLYTELELIVPIICDNREIVDARSRERRADGLLRLSIDPLSRFEDMIRD
jgi:hypothetical protein